MLELASQIVLEHVFSQIVQVPDCQKFEHSEMDGKLPDRDDIGQSKISKRKKMLEVQLG